MVREFLGLVRWPVVDHARVSGLGLDCAAMGLEWHSVGVEGGLLDSVRLIFSCVASLAFASTAASSAGAEAPQPVGDCASVTASARFAGSGYRHIVTLTNGCQQPVSCEVWTDVDPTPHHTLRANPGKSAEVIVRIGSPASGVQAGKACRFTR